MKKYRRPAIVTVFGMVSMCLLTWGLYALQDMLQVHGYTVSPGIFLIVFFAAVGGEGVGRGHAEVTGVNAARNMGLTPIGTAASRPICANCAATLRDQWVPPLSRVK